MAVTQSDKPKVKLTAATDKITGDVPITTIEWYSKAASAGDDLLVVDDEGDTILQTVATGTNFYKEYLVMGTWTDPEISVIDSGTVYINRYTGRSASTPVYGSWANP